MTSTRSSGDAPRLSRTDALIDRVARMGGVVDLAGGAMLFVLATGLGIVAPAVMGGFATAAVVGLSGAVSLALAHALSVDAGDRSALARLVAVSLARGGGAVGQVLVLVSMTGLVALSVVAVVSLVLTAVTLTLLGVRAVRVRRA